MAAEAKLIEGVNLRAIKELEDGSAVHRYSTITETNIKDVRQLLKIDFSKTYNKPQPCITIGGERFATFGNFCVIIGKLKAGKRFY